MPCFKIIPKIKRFHLAETKKLCICKKTYLVKTERSKDLLKKVFIYIIYDHCTGQKFMHYSE
ncbi:MAG: hypothetical protein DRI57_19960 [Deltaproteobacteria bacterium]|nr:MAG: hypothetical protein DRI57_19960 [Deltaproteobacteria bacterium]